MAPRAVFREADLFITRRVHGRQMRLRPCKKTNRVVRYVTAVIARKLGIGILAICVLSDHWHVVVHDPFGRIVHFTRDCHHFIASAVNETFGDEGSLWDSRQTSRVRLITPADTLSRIAYTMANPVKHGLVKHGRSWPGVRHVWGDRPRTVKRPPKFFRNTGAKDDGTWPETVELVMTRPKGFEGLSDNELAILIRQAIKAAEDSFRAERAERREGYLGRANVRNQSRYSRAKSREKKRQRKRTIACADPERYRLELAKERAWKATYRDRLERWCDGDRSVEFPHGTYKMRVLHNVNVADPPT